MIHFCSADSAAPLGAGRGVVMVVVAVPLPAPSGSDICVFCESLLWDDEPHGLESGKYVLQCPAQCQLEYRLKTVPIHYPSNPESHRFI